MKTKILLFIFALSSSSLLAQWQLAGNAIFPGQFFGTINNQAVNIRTNNTQRMTILGGLPGGATTGFVGINTANPQFQLHVNPPSTNNATALGWNKGILMSNQGALMWQGNPITGLNYFMAHASGSPTGDFYQGIASGIGGAVNYASKVHVGSGVAGVPQASTQVFKNLLVEEAGFNRSLGVNLIVPKRSADVLHATDPQLRLTQTQNPNPLLGVWTDFRTSNAGDLNIMPRNGATARRVGIDVTSPTHKLDIAGDLRIRVVNNDPTPDFILLGNPLGPNDMEVLKLAFTGNPTDVLLGNGTWGPASATMTANNGLSVSGTNVQLGQALAAAGNPAQLINTREIPMNGFNIMFNDGPGGLLQSKVGIGYPAAFGIPNAKLDILNAGTALGSVPIALRARNDIPGSGGGSIAAQILNLAPSVTNEGITAMSQNATTLNRGGAFNGFGGSMFAVGITATGSGSAANNIGVGARTSSGTSISNKALEAVASRFAGSTGPNFGVWSIANNGTQTVGGYFEATGSGLKYGVHSFAPATGTDRAGYFQGWVEITAGGPLVISDSKFKNVLDTLDDALSVLNNLQPIQFTYDTVGYASMNFASKKFYGFTAENIQASIPEAVVNSKSPQVIDTLGNVVHASDDHLSVDYFELLPFMVRGIQQLKTRNDSLKNSNDSLKAVVTGINNRLSQLEECISKLNLCEGNNQMAPQNSNQAKTTDITLSDGPSIILDQNVPNPFAEQTVITYELPQSVQKAQMLFYNAEGKLINSVDLNERGKGSINVFANDLSNGIYTYTLVVDGQVKGTKRMVKNR